MSASLKTCLLIQGYLKFNVNCADIFHTIYQPFLDYKFLQLQTHSNVNDFQLDIVESPRLQMISRVDFIPGLYLELFLDRDF